MKKMEDIDQPKVIFQMRSLLLFLLMWQFLFNVSDAGLSMPIIFMYHVVKLFHSITNNDIVADCVAC